MPSDLKLSVHSVTPDVTLTLSDPYIGSAYSPQVDVSEIEGGHRVTITHKAPSGITTDTFDVLDGVDGTDGVDGVSPTVEIESTTDAHTITITDADGAHSYTVDTYADEEAARATAESSRVAAESSRVTAEQARVTAESSRAAAESARVTAEASRATAEQTRAAADSSRDEAEQARATAENARATAESARATAEQGRATAEQARAAAETARASAESGRVTTEQGRASAENARASAESARVTAESARASAETSRANAETARSNAELARASEWATIRAETEDAISAAEDATDAAESAASDATAAAAEARAASAATWLSGNVLFGELAEGAVLTADDVYAAPPRDVDVYGASTQASYTGKNLVEWAADSYTNTTASTQNAVSYCLGSLAAKWTCPSSLIGQTIVLSMDDGGSGYVPYIRFYDADGALLDTYSRGTRSGTRIYTVGTVPEGTATIGFGGTLNSGKTVKHPMVEVGTTMTDYEPYVGGKAAPNPDYPQPIKSVDDLTLHVCGKNLFDENDHPVINGYLNANSMSIVANSAHICTYLPCASDVSYAISKNRVTSNERLGMAFTSETPTVGVPLLAVRALSASQYDGVIGETMTLSLTAPSNAKYLVVWLGWSSITLDSMQIELGSTATTYAPYVGASVTIPLSNNVGRSLPDGTRDTLTLSYIGPSTEHEGWGVFGAELVQHCKEADMGELTWRYTTNNGFFDTTIDDMVTALNGVTTVLCDHYNGLPCMPINSLKNMANLSVSTRSSYKAVAVKDTDYTDATDFTTAVTGYKLVYPLDEPITTDLGTIELPILPNPLTAWADGGSAQPTMSMEYERSLSIVIPRIEAAISDLATS